MALAFATGWTLPINALAAVSKMKFYQLSYDDPDLGTILEWYPSRSAAKKAEVEQAEGYASEERKDWYSEDWRPYIPEFRIREFNIKTTKAEILEFLNSWADRNNG